MRKAVVYARQARLFVRTCSQTNTGLWIDDGPCVTLKLAGLVPEDLGRKVAESLDRTRLGISHPTSWEHLSDPLLEAAGVRTMAKFERSSKCVNVELGDDLCLKPTRNLGARAGFVVVESQVLRLPNAGDHLALGKGVLAALSAAE